jgi:hypothetical protein
MKVSYEERLAIDFGLQRRCDCGNNVVLSVRVEGKRRQAIELRNHLFRMPTASLRGEGNIGCTVIGKVQSDTAESQNLSMRGNSKRENREIPSVSGAEPHMANCQSGQRTSLRERLT